MTLKRQTLEGRVDAMVREYEGPAASASDIAAPGASFANIKEAWRYTADTRTRDFNERLPNGERQEHLAREDRLVAEAHDFDRSAGRSQPQDIEGVYLETNVAS